MKATGLMARPGAHTCNELEKRVYQAVAEATVSVVFKKVADDTQAAGRDLRTCSCAREAVNALQDYFLPVL